MSTRKCGCVYSDARNNSAVRARMEMPGSLMKRCAKHQAEWDAAIASEPIELTAEQKLARADTRIAELEQSVTVRDTEIARLETDLELARRDHASALRLVTDIRFALGDDGGRMQPGFVEWCRELRADAERMNWLEASTFSPVTRASIDVARDGHQGDSDDDR